ncbi:MAG: hypothetical protein ACI4EQ_09495 [Lachnospiraceae bacterium]
MAQIKGIKLTPAKCAVDLGDGSERGFYVNQDYILQKLHRPHRGINLMYCYYPNDEAWPKRAQDAYADKEVSFAWDYPYDNYFPYLGGLNGSKEGEPFTCMRDVRRHGQDVVLTLTCDPAVTDEQIVAIAKDLKPYGRMMLRLNHEATGDWFSFNKRASYQEVADFFVRFHKILKEYAPNVKTILCIGGVEDANSSEITKEKEFTEAVRTTDIWSVDKYLALNWGWPYEVAEKDNHQHKKEEAAYVYEMTKRSFYRYKELCGGVVKPMLMSEFNADGDVTGPFDQVKMVQEFCDMIKEDPERWFSGFTFYQFRDDGRLGLEITDPNNPDVGVEQPMLAAYRDIINDDFFKPGMEETGTKELPVTLRWGGAEDAEGLCMELAFEGNPVFAEANFNGSLKEANLMMEINGRWFYKASGVTFVDFMPAFFEQKLTDPCTIKLTIFAPPATGENDPAQGADWLENYYYEMKELPDIRLRFEPIM